MDYQEPPGEVQYIKAETRSTRVVWADPPPALDFHKHVSDPRYGEFDIGWRVLPAKRCDPIYDNPLNLACVELWSGRMRFMVFFSKYPDPGSVDIRDCQTVICVEWMERTLRTD
jgi:hypothetical protein